MHQAGGREDTCARNGKVTTIHRPDLLQSGKTPAQEIWELRGIVVYFVFTTISTE